MASDPRLRPPHVGGSDADADEGEAAEAAALARVAHALRSYSLSAHAEVARWRRSYAGLSARHT